MGTSSTWRLLRLTRRSARPGSGHGHADGHEGHTAGLTDLGMRKFSNIHFCAFGSMPLLEVQLSPVCRDDRTLIGQNELLAGQDGSTDVRAQFLEPAERPLWTTVGVGVARIDEEALVALGALVAAPSILEDPAVLARRAVNVDGLTHVFGVPPQAGHWIPLSHNPVSRHEPHLHSGLNTSSL